MPITKLPNETNKLEIIAPTLNNIDLATYACFAFQPLRFGGSTSVLNKAIRTIPNTQRARLVKNGDIPVPLLAMGFKTSVSSLTG